LEQIIIVDENDNCLGVEEKGKCHERDGILHRAFLAMVFNNKGELLLARRSPKKKLWPGYWDGTVASHLFMGEDYEGATRRRLQQEIGLVTGKIEYLFKFHYRIGYEDLGTEHEICAVLRVSGIGPGGINPNNDEISEIKFVDPQILLNKFDDNKRSYTPWLMLAMQHLSNKTINPESYYRSL
jgi:isopentenyl-diphosphate delta-isomerase